jgi:hypothetical protein
LKLIGNLRKDCDKSSKAADELRAKNADLAKTLSSKEQKIRDLEKVLADWDETPVREINNVKTKLKLLFEEYGQALKQFGVRPGSFLKMKRCPLCCHGLRKNFGLFLA